MWFMRKKPGVQRDGTVVFPPPKGEPVDPDTYVPPDWDPKVYERVKSLGLGYGMMTTDALRAAVALLSAKIDLLDARLAALEARTGPSEGRPVPESHQHETPASGPISRKEGA